MKSAHLVLVGSFVAWSVALSACGGQSFRPDTGSPAAQSVDPLVLSGTVVSCGDGFAHPNICCENVSGQGASCDAYPDTPFQPCGTSQQTYPDPRSCCPLSGTGACQAVDAGFASGGSSGGGQGTGSGSGSGTGSSCMYPCPPGFAQSGAACCPVATAGAIANTACVTSVLAIACPAVPVCACPLEADGGESACSCPPASGCTPPPPPSCGSCPQGWQVPAGEPGLCCQEEANDIIACFSQAVPPPIPVPAVDAGVGTGDAGISSPGCVCSEPVCPPNAACAPLPCDCDAGPTAAADAGASDAGDSCTISSDCHGPLPQIAERCPDGGTGVARWVCESGTCVMPPLCE